MFSRFQRFYNSIKLTADVLVLIAAFGLGYWTRFYSGLPHESLPPIEDTWVSLAMVLFIFPVVFRQSSLYTTNRARSHIGEVFEIFKAMLFGTLILVALTYFVRERYSRATIGIFVVYAFIGVSAVRVAFRVFFNAMRRRGYNLKSILIIGAGQLGQRVIDTIEGHRELGFRISGVLTRKREKVGTKVLGVEVLGMISEVDRVLDATPVDQVIIALPIEESAVMKELMEQLALRTVDVKVVPDLYQYITLRGGLEEFGGLPIISLQGGPLDGWNLIAKRSFDVLLSAVALLLAAPLLILVALAVRLTSRGPVLYRQERMGMDGRTFQMLKFRTMQADAEGEGAVMAAIDDPRRTPIGALLRRSSIDELPQFLNVFKGEMSLVGPRPEMPYVTAEYEPWQWQRFRVPPGITGWWQVNGRSDKPMHLHTEDDLYYIQNYSFWLDLRILLKTVLVVWQGHGAY